MQVLMGTLALVAGCSTAQRAEVSGVVRDRATGRTIAGARVIGADGSLTETDADGRFRLYVRGAQADVRITAAGHSPEHLEIEGREACVELAPIDETWGAREDGAHVVTFVEETWLHDGGVFGDAARARTCAETSLAQAHSTISCASCHGASSTASSCATCHGAEAQTIRSAIASPTIAPHDALGGGCLACHGESASHGDARAACVRCHGAEASARSGELGRFYALATSSAADDGSLGTTFEMRSTLDVRGSEAAIATWARALARDRSGGVHDPRTTLAIGRALDRP